MPAPRPTLPVDETSLIDVTLLKNLRYGLDHRPAGHRAPLPYRIDHLERHGLRLHATDAPYRPGLTGAHDPTVQTAALAAPLLRNPATLAMFESSAHPYGLLRERLPPARRATFAVISCWLGEVLVAASPTRRRWLRTAYASVDRLWVLSRNQVPLLTELLGLDERVVRYLPFGVDHTGLRPEPDLGTGPLLAVGRDRGRDWPTLLTALAAAGDEAQVVGRAADLAGLDIPANVEVLAPVSRDRYLALLGQARAVLVPSQVLAYPSGQTVTLEAMALGRLVVATSTPALDDYLDPGRTALTVAPRDVDGWVDVLASIRHDQIDRAGIGRAARAAVEDRFTAERMWAAVAGDLHALVATRRAR